MAVSIRDNGNDDDHFNFKFLPLNFCNDMNISTDEHVLYCNIFPIKTIDPIPKLTFNLFTLFYIMVILLPIINFIVKSNTSININLGNLGEEYKLRSYSDV